MIVKGEQKDERFITMQAKYLKENYLQFLTLSML